MMLVLHHHVALLLLELLLRSSSDQLLPSLPFDSPVLLQLSLSLQQIF